MNPSDTDSGAPNCWQCRHFSVSWDPNLPYACRLMGFKSRITPALEVLRADGRRLAATPYAQAHQQGRQPDAADARAERGDEDGEQVHRVVLRMAVGENEKAAGSGGHAGRSAS